MVRGMNKYDEIAEKIDKPTDNDKERIRRMILRYDRKYPGYIKAARDQAKAEHALLGGQTQKFGLVNKQASGRVLFEIPDELYHAIVKVYPTMFLARPHLRWFIKNFKELLVPEKY